MSRERDDLHVVGVEAFTHRVPGDERRAQHRELRVPGAGEFLGGRVEKPVREWLAQRLLGPFEYRPRRMVTPRQSHAWCLSALTWEDDRDAQEQTSGWLKSLFPT